MFERLSNATLKINCGNSCGSGFHFINEELVITNHHVIENHLTNGDNVQAITEAGIVLNLSLVTYSDKNKFDFALLKIIGNIPNDRIILRPKVTDHIIRGTEICFSGYPHGIDDLLVHKAVVSGPFNEIGFYIDGSVNRGNSGGPIIDIIDGSVIGIITNYRFLKDSELNILSNKAVQLQKQCKAIAGQITVKFGGINFGEFAKLMSESLVLSNSAIQLNANTGIGIGYNINYVVEECKKLGYC